MTAMPIAYETQLDPQNSRMCGAACLSMVYRSLGKPVSQLEIWPAIAKRNHLGSVASTTHLMALDALNRGFSALAFQARHPLHALKLCQTLGAQVILNHRSSREAQTGHYSVLVDMDDNNVFVHDPSLGPSRRLSHGELMELWQPGQTNSEIIGNVLIAIAAAEAPVPAGCEFCRTPMPPAVECPRCKRPVGLRPGGVLGCIGEACIARIWNYVCCPACDWMWTLQDQPKNAAPSSPAGAPASLITEPGPPEDPWKLNPVFVALDKFCTHILSLPGLRDRPDVREQIDFLRSGKEKLKLAQAEQNARHEERRQHLAAIKKSAIEAEQAHLKKVEELNTPSPPLDGFALGSALLKNLGLGRPESAQQRSPRSSA
jgi:hypothetical protein